MSSLQNFDYNGKLIQSREYDGYVNLTQMCQANRKLIGDFLRLESTKDYLHELASDMDIPISQLIVVKKGNSSDFTQGTWGHKLVAISLARWISPKFAVWCDAHVFRLMDRGETSLAVDPLEELRMRRELALLENEKAQAELKLLQLRQYVTTALPEPVQQKILGYQVVEKIEYRDRIIKDEQVINHGDTITKTELCHRYGFLTRNGTPDYKRLNLFLGSSGVADISEAWKMSATIQENSQLRRDYLPMLDAKMMGGERQMYLGE